jgi:hypothetical protein
MGAGDPYMATIYLDADVRRRLQTLSRRTGRPQAELIREALARFLETRDGFKLPSWVGSWTEGLPTDSSTIKQEMRSLRGEYLEHTCGGGED